MITKRLLSAAVAILTALSSLAAQPYAVVKVPAANLREKPRHGSELVSQGVMGTPLRVKSQQGEWLSVVMPDGYEGHMIENSVQLMGEAEITRWKISRRAIVNAISTRLYDMPSETGETVSPLQLACVVEILDTTADGRFLHSRLPDGREGFIATGDVAEFIPFGDSGLPISEKTDLIISRAKQMVGQEYLWGGTSAKANDCSGFTRVLFQSAGTYLPRDAWQQALVGRPVTKGELQPGDLVFFSNAGGRVVHVGLYMGDGKMIHSSGRVRIDRLFPGNDGIPMYDKTPSAFRRVLTGVPLKSDTTANQLYFNK